MGLLGSDNSNAGCGTQSAIALVQEQKGLAFFTTITLDRNFGELSAAEYQGVVQANGSSRSRQWSCRPTSPTSGQAEVRGSGSG